MSKVKEFMFELADKLGKNPDEVTQEDFEKELIERFASKDLIHLCKCNNCDIIYEDLNPQIDSKLYPFNNQEPLIPITDDGGFMWACPKCQTDSYLQDNIN